MEQVKFATIGTSKITQNFIDGTKISKKLLHCAIYSRTYEQGNAFSQCNGNLPIYTSLDELCKSDIEAVYVATPNKFHYEQCKYLLNHGKHVICEKSISAQPKQVEELVLLARKNNLIFLEALMFMHLPSRHILADTLGKIGNIKSVRLEFCQRSSRYDAYCRGELPNIFNPECETGALLDLGVYLIYPALYFFGKPKSISAKSAFLQSGVDGSGSVIMEYDNKLISLNYSKLCQSRAPSQFIGDGGCVTVDSISTLGGVDIYDNQGNKTHLWDGEEKEALMSHEAADFADYILHPKENREYYNYCTELMLETAEIMYEIRMQSGLFYPSDKE